MARISLSEAGGPNVCAFLDMLAWSEIGPALLAVSDDGYNVIVGSTAAHPILFQSYADHPRALMVLKSGIKSTAAGRPQFIEATWDDVRRKLRLADFSPINQDRGAIELLREHGALPHILAGTIPKAIEIASAIRLDAPVWASLPGAGYGQHENRLMDCLRAYGAALAKYESLPAALGIK
jgi:muramidase (phage lysozyme)